MCEKISSSPVILLVDTSLSKSTEPCTIKSPVTSAVGILACNSLTSAISCLPSFSVPLVVFCVHKIFSIAWKPVHTSLGSRSASRLSIRGSRSPKLSAIGSERSKYMRAFGYNAFASSNLPASSSATNFWVSVSKLSIWVCTQALYSAVSLLISTELCADAVTAEALVVAGAVAALLAAGATSVFCSVFCSVFWQAVNSNADIVRGNIDKVKVRLNIKHP